MAKILVVDDDESVLLVVSEVFRDAGHAVVAAFNAAATWTLLEGVDAAFVDHHLGTESGLAVIARIRAYDSALPVVLMTGDAPDRAAMLAKRAGALDVLIKPFDIDILSAALERALRPSARIEARALPNEYP